MFSFLTFRLQENVRHTMADDYVGMKLGVA